MGRFVAYKEVHLSDRGENPWDEHYKNVSTSFVITFLGKKGNGHNCKKMNFLEEGALMGQVEHAMRSGLSPVENPSSWVRPVKTFNGTVEIEGQPVKVILKTPYQASELKQSLSQTPAGYKGNK